MYHFDRFIRVTYGFQIPRGSINLPISFDFSSDTRLNTVVIGPVSNHNQLLRSAAILLCLVKVIWRLRFFFQFSQAVSRHIFAGRTKTVIQGDLFFTRNARFSEKPILRFIEILSSYKLFFATFIYQLICEALFILYSNQAT